MKHLPNSLGAAGTRNSAPAFVSMMVPPSARDHAAFLQCGGCVLLVEPRIDLERRAESREEIGVGVG